MTTGYNEPQLDALRELANIGAGNAATALSLMLGQEVTLSVPRALASPRRSRSRTERRAGHDWLVVTELVEPELDCPDPEDPEPVEPEPVEPEPVELEPVEAEPVEPEPVVVPELVDPEPVLVPELVDPELVPAPDDEDVLAGVAVAALVDLVLASAGSWPVTSTVKISPQAARNSATAIAITHLRILRTRSWRAARRVAEVRRSAGRDVRGCRGAKGRSAVCSIPGGGVICCRFQWSSVLPQTPRRAYDVFLRPVGSAYEGARPAR